MRPVEICRLSRRDSIETARERLYGLETGAQVWLVVPWGHRALNNRLGLRRISRAADDCALELHIVSRHAQTRLLALFIPVKPKKISFLRNNVGFNPIDEFLDFVVVVFKIASDA